MSIFDEQPDGDPHGECAAEIHRLEARITELEARLEITGPYDGIAARDETIRLLEAQLDAIGSLASHNIPSYAFGDNEAACDMAGRLSDIQDLSHSANTVATPVMDAAPACEQLARDAERWRKFCSLDADVYINTTGESYAGGGFSELLAQYLDVMAERNK